MKRNVKISCPAFGYSRKTTYTVVKRGGIQPCTKCGCKNIKVFLSPDIA